MFISDDWLLNILIFIRSTFHSLKISSDSFKYSNNSRYLSLLFDIK